MEIKEAKALIGAAEKGIAEILNNLQSQIGADVRQIDLHDIGSIPTLVARRYSVSVVVIL